MLVNTREFQRDAQFHKKNGVYTKAPAKTMEHRLYWEEQTRRCLEGYTIGDTYITGYHYFYLNFCKIMRSADTFGTIHADRAKMASGDKDEDFPAFWDGDHQYFNVVERCENPWNEKIDIRGLSLPENDFKRKHLFVLKARGKGFSFKGGSMMTRNYFLIPKSKSFAIASDTEFLTKDGILTKAWEYMNFIDAQTAWRKRRLKDGPMLKMSGYKQRIGGVDAEVGYKSQMIGVTLKNDIQKARGKRGKLIIWEEVGKFPGFKRAYGIARPSVEDNDIVTGFMIAQGTGGTEGANFEDIEDMFYHPEAYKALALNNIWDEGASANTCSYFFPTYLNSGTFMDENGNSHIEEAKNFEVKEREVIAAKASSPNEVDERAAENPFCPREACLAVSGNIYPKLLLIEHKNNLLANPDMNAGEPVELEYYIEGGKQKIRPTTNPEITSRLKPIMKYPTPKDAGEGCMVIYEHPFRNASGIIPDNLYYIAYDPYAQTGGTSLGSAGVYKRINPLSQPDDICVCDFDARYDSTMDFDRRLFMLAEYYNAMIGFENDRGDVYANARLLGKVHLLEPQFTLEYSNELKDSPVGRPYGMNMTKPRKLAGHGYNKDWLMRKRGFDPRTNKIIYNLHTIRSLAKIDEYILANDEGNFDRVSREIIARFYEKEIDFQERDVVLKNAKRDNFLEREMYTGADEFAVDDSFTVDDYEPNRKIIYHGY